MKLLATLTITAVGVAVVGEYRHQQRLQELTTSHRRLDKKLARYREYSALEDAYARLYGRREALTRMLRDRMNRGF